MNNQKRYQIIGVSDVAVGYGSPQVPLLMKNLADLYQISSLIIEPDQMDKKPKNQLGSNCTTRRILLDTFPFSPTGRIEYIQKAANEINQHKPDILVIFCSFTFPVLYKLNFRPKHVIYASIESIEAYGNFDVQMNKAKASDLDMVIFPEENRAIFDSQRCQFDGIPTVIAYNVSNDRIIDHIIPAEERKLRILYSGTLDVERTYADYFLDEGLPEVPIDIYGAISKNSEEILGNGFAETNKPLYFKGFLPSERLAEIRKEFAYSIIMWAPINENQTFAAPNKFFEAIADGVPPIAAPHPQCKTIIERYDCGILMDDWTKGSFLKAVDLAMRTFETPRYAEMVENCRKAIMNELNWPDQFKKIKPHLPENINGR